MRNAERGMRNAAVPLAALAAFALSPRPALGQESVAPDSGSGIPHSASRVPDSGDPFDPRMRLAVPGLSFDPIDALFAGPLILGAGGRRVPLSLGGVRVSSLLAGAFDESYLSNLTLAPMSLAFDVGPIPGALLGDALGGSIDLVPPSPRDDPYRPMEVSAAGRAGFAADFGGPAGDAWARFGAGDFAAVLSMAGIAPGAANALWIDAARIGETLAGNATLDLDAGIGDGDRLRMLFRIDGASGAVRGPSALADGFLRLDGAESRVLEAIWRDGSPERLRVWALARSAERSLSAFDPGRDRWSRSDDSLWAVAGGAAAPLGERDWLLDLAFELRAEGVGSSTSRGFAGGAASGHDDLLGDWPLRTALDGSSRAGGTVSAVAGVRDTKEIGGAVEEVWAVRGALALATYRLFLPEDPYGQASPESYARTERWEVEPSATIEGVWTLGDGLAIRGALETGARPPAIEEIAPAGVDPAAGIRWSPSWALEPERSWGGRLSVRLAFGLIDVELAYHGQWISGAIVPAAQGVADAGGLLPVAFRNTSEFLQGAALAGTFYLHRDLTLRLLVETSHGWAEDGAGGEFRPMEVAPISFLAEFAYSHPDGWLTVGLYGGFRWRPDGWEASPPEARLAAACVLGEVRCTDRQKVPLGLFLQWSIIDAVGIEVRAGDLAMQGDGPSVQGFATARY